MFTVRPYQSTFYKYYPHKHFNITTVTELLVCTAALSAQQHFGVPKQYDTHLQAKYVSIYASGINLEGKNQCPDFS